MRSFVTRFFSYFERELIWGAPGPCPCNVDVRLDSQTLSRQSKGHESRRLANPGLIKGLSVTN